MGELKQNIGRVISVFYKEVAQINANILLSNKAVIGDILSNTDAVVNDIQANLTGTHGNPGQLLNLYFRGKTIHEKIQHAVSDNISETTSEISVSTANLVEELQRQLQEYIANTYTLENAIPPPKIHYPFGLKYQHDDDSDYVRHSVSSDIISEPLFPLKLTPFDHFVVRLDTDEKDCFITGLDIMPDGRLILADYDNSKIKVLSQYGVDLSYLTLREEPTDIAVINESEAAVSVNNNKIVVIEIDPHHQISVRQSIILQQGQWADRLAVYENNLVFTCNKYSDENDAIQMMDLNGGAKWNVYANSSDNDKEQIECKLFNEIDFLTVVSGEQEDFVVATDEFKHSITLISAASGELRKVLMFQNKSPFSITAGERANLYVCSKSGEIRHGGTNVYCSC